MYLLVIYVDTIEGIKDFEFTFRHLEAAKRHLDEAKNYYGASFKGADLVLESKNEA
jgi:hypothetical protein